jgi:hypothetical protein
MPAPCRATGWSHARACALLSGLLGVFVLGGGVSAHISSNGFLELHIDRRNIEGTLEIAVRDAELAVGIDSNHDGRVTWGELRSAEPQLVGYLFSHVTFSAQGRRCDIVLRPLEVKDRADGHYAWLPFSGRCEFPIASLDIRYTVLEGLDPSHRGLLTLTAGNTVQVGVLGGTATQATYSVLAPDRWRAFRDYFKAGVWHILSGIDHLLFLISLLLPAVLLRKSGRWEPVQGAQPALVGVLKVVTAFTLAHSITLTLAALDIVRLPSRLTESVIAASIIVAALNNLFPIITERRARIAFGFGLLHGFGFASVLSDMGLPPGARLISLFSFNLGIEAGQLSIVLIVMPIFYALREGSFYRRAVMPFGSAAIALLALVWLVQRAVFPAG